MNNFSEIPGKYFAADLSANDLLGIIESHPILFWTGLIALVAIGVIYLMRHLAKKKEVS